jgi:hypothetical protein
VVGSNEIASAPQVEEPYHVDYRRQAYEDPRKLYASQCFATPGRVPIKSALLNCRATSGLILHFLRQPHALRDSVEISHIPAGRPAHQPEFVQPHHGVIPKLDIHAGHLAEALEQAGLLLQEVERDFRV